MQLSGAGTIDLLPLVSEWSINRTTFKEFLESNYDFYDNKEYVVFDTETTGFGKPGDEIIEIGAIIVKGNKIKHKDGSFREYEYFIQSKENFLEMDSFAYFILPSINPETNEPKEIPEAIVELTHITLDKIIMGLSPNAPEGEQSFENFVDAFSAFIDYIDGRTLIAHNAAFDIKMFKLSFSTFSVEINNALNNIEHPLTKRKIAEFFQLEVIDTYSDASKALTLNPNLTHRNSDLSSFFGLDATDDLLHRAIYDVVFTGRNFYGIYEHIGNVYSKENIIF